MPTITGREDVRRFIAQIPAATDKLLRGAARAGAKVVADEAKAEVASEVVRDGIVTRSKVEPGQITVTITVQRGWARSVGIWLEYGTSPHFITVDQEQSGGRTAARVNKLSRGGTLIINGQPVGTTVLHPGARSHPFLSVALDRREADAVKALQSYLTARWTPAGIASAADNGGDE